MSITPTEYAVWVDEVNALENSLIKRKTALLERVGWRYSFISTDLQSRWNIRHPRTGRLVVANEMWNALLHTEEWSNAGLLA